MTTAMSTGRFMPMQPMVEGITRTRTMTEDMCISITFPKSYRGISRVQNLENEHAGSTRTSMCEPEPSRKKKP